jgi:hypothetical protein
MPAWDTRELEGRDAEPDGTWTWVDSLPNCDLCAYDVKEGRADEGSPAFADAATVMGSWAYVCEKHFRTHCLGLGVGRGQRLVVRAK